MRRCTSTVSPTSNSGASFFLAASSTSVIKRFFMALTFLFRFDVVRLPRAALAAGQRLLAPPAGVGGLVAAQQALRALQAADDGRRGVLRVFEPPRFTVRLLRHALGVAQHAGDVAHYCVDHDHRRHLAAVADEVADRDFPRPQAQTDTLVEALVAAAQQQQAFLL